PAALKTIVERCLAKDPTRRYQKAEEVRRALESAQSGARPRRSLVAVAATAAAIVAAIALTTFRDKLSFAPRTPRIQSLAVLPLENLSGDPSQEYFADGMTDALITDLGKLRGDVRVIGRSSVMAFKGSKNSPAEIAKKLNVDALMTGAIVRF